MARKPCRSALGQAKPSLNVAQTPSLYSQNSNRGLRLKPAEPSQCQHFPVATVHQHQGSCHRFSTKRLKCMSWGEDWVHCFCLFVCVLLLLLLLFCSSCYVYVTVVL